MINKCNSAGKPVITATQMLESMIKNPRPTRAEATDVGNAVHDGSDCVMLSGETAKGDYPIEAVNIMSKICMEAEAAIDYHLLYDRLKNNINSPLSVSEAITSSAVRTANDLHAALIITFTETGATSRLIAKYRPQAPVLVLTVHDHVARQTLVSRGLLPLEVGTMIGPDQFVQKAIKRAKEMNLCKTNDLVVVTSGARQGVSGLTNVLKVVTVQ